eukprot:1187103-Prorocentrum_minimum.AAC.2
MDCRKLARHGWCSTGGLQGVYRGSTGGLQGVSHLRADGLQETGEARLVQHLPAKGVQVQVIERLGPRAELAHVHPLELSHLRAEDTPPAQYRLALTLQAIPALTLQAIPTASDGTRGAAPW